MTGMQYDMKQPILKVSPPARKLIKVVDGVVLRVDPLACGKAFGKAKTVVIEEELLELEGKADVGNSPAANKKLEKRKGPSAAPSCSGSPRPS